MDAESQLIEMLNNEVQVKIAKHIYEDFGYHPKIVQDLIDGLSRRLDTEFHRKVSGFSHMDIHNPKI